MTMKKVLIKLSFLLVATFFVFACSKEENNELLSLTENDFKVMPEKPSATDEISIVTYDCGYNQLDEVKKDGFNIEVIKNFNSMMKQPCVLTLDTIPLGKLSAGTYQIKFIIVDLSTNILASDKIFHTGTQELVVK